MLSVRKPSKKKHLNLKKLKQPSPWFLSLGLHLGLVCIIGILLLSRQTEPPVVMVTLETISSKEIPIDPEPKPDLEPEEVEPEPIAKPVPAPKKVVVLKRPKASPPQAREKQSFSLGTLTVKEQYLHDLKNFFQRQLIYPSASISLREKGRVEVAFTIYRSGAISQVELHVPCQFSRLNRAAVDLVQSARSFRAFPSVMTEDSIRLAIPIDYAL